MDWNKLVQLHHKYAHPSEEYLLVTGPSASSAEIESTSASLGYSFSPEFVEFYSTMNGFGISAPGEDPDWFFLPLSKISETRTHTRDMLDTHPTIAERFIPLVDWMCGDYTGYIKPEGQSDDFALFMLEHEQLEYDSSQDPNEFLFPLYSSIEEFLTPPK